MELNAEQIIKALEWCSELRLCVDCPMRAEGYFSHSGNACRKALMENALSLIKKITEENERLRARVIEENHLRHQVEEMLANGMSVVRADTVREMRERLDKHFCHDPAFLGVEQRLIMDVIAKIAKELLEGE